jgi:hypothetical protein
MGWTKRYPRIAEAALKNRIRRFAIDGEAVSDFNALHSGRHNEEVQLCAFDVPVMSGPTICAACRCRCARPILNGCRRAVGAPVEAMRRLRVAMEKASASSDRYSRRMLWLTVIVTVLTAVQVVGAIDVIRHWIK